jgi:hypothetical protein
MAASMEARSPNPQTECSVGYWPLAWTRLVAVPPDDDHALSRETNQERVRKNDHYLGAGRCAAETGTSDRDRPCA